MKKFKLFTTIASLCLAVALMVFGVYAATQASVKIGSTITFDASANISGTLTVKSYNVAKVENGEYDLSALTASETFTYKFLATDPTPTGVLTPTKNGEETPFTADKKVIIYVVQFNSDLEDANVVLQVEDSSFTVKNGQTEVNGVTKTNGLKNPSTAGTKATPISYNMIVEITEDLTADATYSVDFTIKLSVGSN